MSDEMKRLVVALIAVVLGAILFLYISGCASTENRREQLQNEHPDCFVMHDLAIECPNPFDGLGSDAGFGTEVKNQKIKKRGNKNGTK